MKDTQTDIAIVGGGPVGLTLALALSRHAPGLAVTLIDAAPPDRPPDRRATAISAGVNRVFEALGVWDDVAADASPITGMRITDSGPGDLYRPLFLNFDGDVAPGRPFAHMVPNRTLAPKLAKAVADAGITTLAPAKVVARQTRSSHADLTLEGGATVSARLVVACDGGRSALRAMAGIGTIHHDYEQAGLVTTIRHAIDHEGLAWEHFLPAGPFASLPLPDQRSSLVWTEKRADAARLATLPEEDLAREIEQRMGSVLGAVDVLEPVQSFPLHLVLARQMVAERLVLAGDAAHVIHPVAGQGLNLGIKDVAALAEILIEARRLGEDIGDAGVLQRYQRWRRFDVAQMAMATDGLVRLFSNESTALRAIRDLGLGLVDRAGPLKKALIGKAAAADGGPKLLRGLAI